MKNTRYTPAKNVPLHTPNPDKQQAAERMSADVAAYIMAGGTISKVTREAYRMSNIEREARRDKHVAMQESLTRIAFHEESSFDSPMQEQAAARMGLVDKTQGVFASVDGIEADLYEGDPRHDAEPDFFRVDDDVVDEEVDEDE